MSTKKLILEIGVGNKKIFENSIALDIRNTSKVSVLGDACKLPFKDNSFDHIYCAHTIEHFSHLEVNYVIREWIRVLKVGGILELRCPDLQIRCFLFFLRPSWDDIINIYGGQDYPQNYHKCGFSYTLLKNNLNELGIVKVKRILDGYKGIPLIPCDLHIKGIKGKQLQSKII